MHETSKAKKHPLRIVSEMWNFTVEDLATKLFSGGSTEWSFEASF